MSKFENDCEYLRNCINGKYCMKKEQYIYHCDCQSHKTENDK